MVLILEMNIIIIIIIIIITIIPCAAELVFGLLVFS